MNKLNDVIDGIIERLRKDQKEDGSWGYAFDTGIKTDCYTIILIKTLHLTEYENLVEKLVKRIESMQSKSGGFKLYRDEKEDNLSLTIEAYVALLYSGYRRAQDLSMTTIENRIRKLGGLAKADMFTKVLLATTGHLDWPKLFPIPVEFILLPPSFPVNFYDFSVFGRSNIAPILLLADSKFQIPKTTETPDISHLYVRELYWWSEDRGWNGFTKAIKKGVNNLIGLPNELHTLGRKQAENYMLDRLEDDGTLLSYYSSTFFMIYALLSVGYTKDHKVIKKAARGLLSMNTTVKDTIHIQYTTAHIWNTSLISHALQTAGASPDDTMVMRANHYLLQRQHTKFGDWAIYQPNLGPGGWGFSHSNTFNPDVDDTTASLRSIQKSLHSHPNYQSSWYRGLSFTLGMQNQDGGFPAFEKGVDKTFLHLLPVQGAEFLLTDPSTPDLTGRTLEFLGESAHLYKDSGAIKRGVNWLIENQRRDGSWYGRWGICYIYGTWAALTGLQAVGVSKEHPSVQEGIDWLKSIQQDDGGWGESCESDSQKTYIPLSKSTVTQTAWAVDALIAYEKEETVAIKKGMEFLLQNWNHEDWTMDYPLGQGMAKAFYIHYHSYRYVFPLLTMGHYKRKFM
ncbi:squalene-hopene cyclase [Bacillus coahuilensis p1.1.43]|uniref:Squalene-hopene cyclase n=1 Tax=Bacillus coahuilensis p1.1.43 TaxID=1150625 RepID=A0A147KC21_9BACI|nr:prenyltransferase/squalene oxidase repeat-containing protein [Bacillus coahuilensis]KUP09118.1 squalene-hopene cyclase [Bacillus coahuilensis p1.1.43]